ncbi:MAG: DUF4329 domain-containing protein [Hyphomicrobiales bacterium]|nr:DUF4329 domain-containing protein [Hyphomicrobiales bacterium]
MGQKSFWFAATTGGALCACSLSACEEHHCIEIYSENVCLSKNYSNIDLEEELVAAAIYALVSIQERPIEENREYCGYIVIDRNNDISVAGPNSGGRTYCKTPIVYKPDIIKVSFHTHGAFDRELRTEIPSLLDFDSVKSEGVDAFIGTPGGRVWHLDYETEIASILCGPENCLRWQQHPLRNTTLVTSEQFTRSDILRIESTGR